MKMVFYSWLEIRVRGVATEGGGSQVWILSRIKEVNRTQAFYIYNSQGFQKIFRIDE